MLSQADALARELAGGGSGANGGDGVNNSGGNCDVNSAAAEAAEDAAALRRMEQMQGIVRAALSCIRRLRSVSACCDLQHAIIRYFTSSCRTKALQRCAPEPQSQVFSAFLSALFFSGIYYLGIYEIVGYITDVRYCETDLCRGQDRPAPRH